MSHLRHRNSAEIFRRIHRLDDALTESMIAGRMEPKDYLVFYNRALIYYDMLDLENAAFSNEIALSMNPSCPDSNMFKAQLLLLQEQFTEGWKLYDWRWKLSTVEPLLPWKDIPEWDGSPTDKRVLLIGDQGYGDIIMFSRFVPWALERLPNAVLASSPEALDLLNYLNFPRAKFFCWNDIPKPDFHCAFSALPKLIGTTYETLPKIPVRNGPRKDTVGISWAGRPTHNNDYNRSLNIEDFLPLNGLQLLSLQQGGPARQLAFSQLKTEKVETKSWVDTAKILEGVGAVVTVDTAVAHLAGALGVPTHLVLPYAPEWRWRLHHTTTPWYDSIKIHRFPKPGDIGNIMHDIAATLREELE